MLGVDVGVLGTFLILVVMFHLSEAAIQYIYNREEFGFSSFCFEREYRIAMSVAVLEFILESWLFPNLKQHQLFHYMGIILVIVGELIRKVGMITAKASFTHQIQYEKRQQHKLVTDGIYKYIRHPGYLGWFIWAPATQLILMNPICFVLFLGWAWYFFYDRIPHEEEVLIRTLFGKQYEDYRARTPTFIPFIK
ncbi:protein-S-isoprenylcysteine O-methyltransferase [Acrasis kona]|uniref:Protein-S-isoprenylcysteine O-methyltransferase n=1 Tax=Acrasis kona TaxID=1008807 RepID=A0AAW2YP26_9EUKA